MQPLLLFFLGAVGLMACQSTASDSATAGVVSNDEIPALFERTGQLAAAVEWPKTKAKVAELKAKIAAEPTNVKPRIQVATIYITETKIPGEHPYY